MTPGDALLGARESRGWSCKGAATRAGIGYQQLANLENDETDPATVRAATLVALLELYWPDVVLRDLLPMSLFRMEPASPSAMGLLVASATNKNLHAAMRRLARERA